MWCHRLRLIGSPSRVFLTSPTAHSGPLKMSFIRTSEPMSGSLLHLGQLLSLPKRYFKSTSTVLSEPPLQRDRVLTVPNALCMARLCSAPLLASWVINHHYCYALAGFVAAGFTDLIDGQIARHVPNQSSRLGSFLDPLADKGLCTALYLSLTHVQLVPSTLTFLVVSRDVLLIIAGLYVRYLSVTHPFSWRRYFDLTSHGAQIQPPFISKANTLIQLAMVFYALLVPVLSLRQDSLTFQSLCLLTATTTFGSGLAYVFQPNTYRFASRSYEHEQMKKVAALALFMVANGLFIVWNINDDLDNLEKGYSKIKSLEPSQDLT